MEFGAEAFDFEEGVEGLEGTGGDDGGGGGFRETFDGGELGGGGFVDGDGGGRGGVCGFCGGFLFGSGGVACWLGRGRGWSGCGNGIGGGLGGSLGCEGSLREGSFACGGRLGGVGDGFGEGGVVARGVAGAGPFAKHQAEVPGAVGRGLEGEIEGRGIPLALAGERAKDGGGQRGAVEVAA